MDEQITYKNLFALNLRNVRGYLQKIWGKAVPQLEASKFFGVSLRTYAAWERNEQHGERSYAKVQARLNTYFHLTLGTADIIYKDLVSVIEESQSARARGTVGEASDCWRLSRRELEDLLQNQQLCHILRIGAELAGKMRGLVEGLRPDLDRTDWIGVARALQEEGEKADLSVWRDLGRVREELYFKSPRPLTARERVKIQKIADEVLEKLRKEEG